MILDKKLVVVMPAYNAEKTLRQTYSEIPHDYVDEVILFDDASKDSTSRIAEELNIRTIVHENNKGYGGNQKTCYRTALEHGADIVVMLHPDYQYSPKLLTAMASMIASGHYDIVLGSRILGGEAIKGKMPVYKYIANRFLTFIENLILGVKLSEYHTGFRAFTRQVLETLPLEENSENFRRSVKYGLGVLTTSMKYALEKLGITHYMMFSGNGRKLKMSEEKPDN